MYDFHYKYIGTKYDKIYCLKIQSLVYKIKRNEKKYKTKGKIISEFVGLKSMMYSCIL